MKSKVYFLALLLTGVFLVSSCNKGNDNKKIVGKWKIDTVEIENYDQVIKQWRDYLVNGYQTQIQMLKDSLAKITANNNPQDSIAGVILNMQIGSLENALSRYQDINNFQQDIQMTFANLKGGTFEFKKDSILVDPRGTEGKWYIKGDSLYFKYNQGGEEAVIIKKLTKDELQIAASENVDNKFTLTIVYVLTPVTETDDQTKVPVAGDNSKNTTN